jgi:two-component system copper resistance phosphate regulon response regulator CusR
MKLLVIEDEEVTARFLRQGFREAGFVVDMALDGVEALNLIQAGAYDLIVLDLMLPGMDGLHVLTWLRESGANSRVLILSARDTVDDRIKGLELGADDYLVKPFAFAELLARAHAILRRPPVREPATLRVGDLELNVIARRATRAGQRLDLTAREFVLLTLLARRTGEVLTRVMIAQSVWNMHFHGDTNVVDVSVRRLRSKIDDPFPTKLLRTVRGIGYVLESPEGDTHAA